MTKENMIVLALSGVLLMVVAIPTGKEKNKTDESKSVQLDTQTVTMDSESNSAQQEAMEEKLAQFLSRMEGAGSDFRVLASGKHGLSDRQGRQ